MARVTRYEEDQVRTDIVREPELARIDTGAEFAAGALNKAIVSGVNAANRFMEKKDEVDTDTSLQELSREMSDYLYETGRGFLTLQGKDAVEARERAMADLQAMRERYSSTLRTPKQQAAFNRAALALETRTRVQVDTHSQKALDQYDSQTSKSAAIQEVQNAFHFGTGGFQPWEAGGPSRFKEGLSRGQNALRLSLERAGQTNPEVIQQQLQDYNSQYALSAVQGAGRNGYDDAKTVFDGLGGFLNGKDALEADALLKRLTEKEVEESWAAKVTAATQLILNDPAVVTRADVLKASMALEDKKLSGAVTAEAARLFSLQKLAKEEAAAEGLQAATEFLDLNPTASVSVFIANYPQEWDAMNKTMQAQVWARIPVETDYLYYADLIQMEPSLLVEEPIEKITGNLSPTDRKEILRLRASYERERAKGNKEPKFTVEAMVNSSNKAATMAAAEGLFGNKEDWGSNNNRKAAAFFQLADHQARLRAKELNVETLPSTEYQAILNNLQRDYLKDPSAWNNFWGRGASTSSLTATEWRGARDIIKGAGMESTPQNIFLATKYELPEILRAKEQLELESRSVNYENMNTLLMYYRSKN